MDVTQSSFSKESYRMSSLLEGIKDLIRHCDDLPNKMSRTEITHYALELASKLKSGADIEELDYYLSRIMVEDSRTAPHTRELAERAFNLFASFKAPRPTT
jgi:hypothetical protein